MINVYLFTKVLSQIGSHACEWLLNMAILISFYLFHNLGVLIFLFCFVLFSGDLRVMYISFVPTYACSVPVTDRQSLGQCLVNEWSKSGTAYLHPSCHGVKCRPINTWSAIPGSTKHSANVGSMLGQRRRRWLNIDAILAQYLVFAGHDSSYYIIAHLLTIISTMYMSANILVFAQILIFCWQSSKCCIPLPIMHMEVIKNNNIKCNSIGVLFINIFHCNAAPQGC